MAIRKSLPLVGQEKRGACETSSVRVWKNTTTQSAIMPTTAGNRPPVNRAAMETPVTEPTVISTMEGGMVSDITAEAESSEVRLPSLLPRLSISGNSAGATAAMSAAFAPEMPETRYIAPSSTYCSPPRRWPSSETRKAIIFRARPAISISAPSSTKSGTASRINGDMPSSIRSGTMEVGMVVAKAMKASVPSRKEKAIGMPMIIDAATKPTKKISRLALPISSSASP